MSEKTPNAILEDIDKFCADMQIKPETLANRLKYPTLIERLKNNQVVKASTIERLYTEMELQRLKMEIKSCNDIRQAVKITHRFLKGRTYDLS